VNIKKMPDEIRQLGKRMTVFERAQFLGERDTSILEFMSDKDRERLFKRRGVTRWDKKPADMKAQASTRSFEGDPFEEEPLKSHRFKQYVNYLRRGI
jgi:hypothetical protein